MNFNSTELNNIIREEVNNLLNETRSSRDWLSNLDRAEPIAMGMARRGEPIAPKTKPDRYPHFKHVNQAMRLFYVELRNLKDDLQYEWEESYKGLFAKEGHSAEILKYTSDVNKALKKIEESDYAKRREIIDESFGNVEWFELQTLLGEIEDILEDSVLRDERFTRMADLLGFVTQVVNARIESSAAGTVGFDLDPAGIRALRKIPAGVDYVKPKV